MDVFVSLGFKMLKSCYLKSQQGKNVTTDEVLRQVRIVLFEFLPDDVQGFLMHLLLSICFCFRSSLWSIYCKIYSAINLKATSVYMLSQIFLIGCNRFEVTLEKSNKNFSKKIQQVGNNIFLAWGIIFLVFRKEVQSYMYFLNLC